MVLGNGIMELKTFKRPGGSARTLFSPINEPRGQTHNDSRNDRRDDMIGAERHFHST
jgi:hypothetical protein